MSIYKGSKLVAGSNTNTVSDIIKLFKHDWYDYSFSDLSWVRADDFEWIYADRYPIAYEHLYADFISTSTWQSETIGSYTIQFKIAPDGHRITDHANEGIVQNIYGQSGVAWYYIIDTVNERFKLPRTKHSMTGLRDTVGKYVEAGLPNITGRFGCDIPDYHTLTATGAFFGMQITPLPSDSGKTVVPRVGNINSSNTLYGFNFDASRSNSVYGKSTTIQPPATQQYLYFYLGQFPVSALVNPDIAETKANTSMDNLNSVGRNIANWSSNVTNCITEIPQDIKLELNNGTLTLKAGSKIYVPNGKNADGSNKFEAIITSIDLSNKPMGNTSTMFIFYNYINNSLTEEIGVSSGSTISPPGTYHTRYDTTINKIIRSINGSVWDSSYQDSFPIAYVTADATTGITSINNIFNGFGYIGSTVFALPGVKGLISNGRNADGSLNNIEWSNDNVSIYTNPNDVSYSGHFIYIPTLGLGASDDVYWKYNENENYFKHENIVSSFVEYAKFSCENGKITSFTSKTTFHALDYNDKATIVSWGIPDYSAGVSEVFTSLTTAPSNGFFEVNGQCYNNELKIELNGIAKIIQKSTNTSYSAYGYVIIPVFKGDTIKGISSYGNTGSIVFYPCRGV